MMTLALVGTFLLVPPVNLLLLALGGFVLCGRGARWFRAGRVMCGVGLGGLFVLALPVTSIVMIQAIEGAAVPLAAAPEPVPGAIVILGGDVSRVGDVPAAVDVGALTLERLREGAALQHAVGLPVLVSGGVIGRDQPSLAVLMARSLAVDFGVPVRWQEGASRDTWENARDTAVLLQAAGVHSVFLVTHAWHMRRALIAFRRFGVQAWPAPVPFGRAARIDVDMFVPRAASWSASYYALHEWIGCAWYALRART